MMKRCLLCVLCALCATLPAAEPVAELLTVRGTTIFPTNVAASVADVAQAVAAAESAAAQAAAAEAAALLVSNAVAGVEEIVNSLEGIGYIRGYVLQFGSGVEASTNTVASIVKFSGDGHDGTNSYWHLWTYFTEDPGVLPVIRYSQSAGRSNTWDAATAVGTAVLDEVLVGETLYEAYRNRIKMPLSMTNAFFRTFADVAGAGTNTVYLPVRNGIAVNGVEPLTATFYAGTNTMRFVGGVRVQ